MKMNRSERFRTISKGERSTCLRGTLVQVPPQPDQVYEPCEELRHYIDPYECVVCSECHQGGDDDLMLLCDLCDSPAHTYCVGLGREVPEGNWFCGGCSPAAGLESSSSSKVQAAHQQAGEIIPKRFYQTTNVEHKGKVDLVTEAVRMPRSHL